MFPDENIYRKTPSYHEGGSEVIYRCLYFGESKFRWGTHRIDGPSFIQILSGRKTKMWFINETNSIGISTITTVGRGIHSFKMFPNDAKIWCVENGIDPLDMSDIEILMMHAEFYD